MKRKITFLISVIIIVVSCSLSLASSYTDVNSGHWAYSAIDYLCELGVINGYPDGGFMPNKSITRAEFSKIIVELLGDNITSSNSNAQFMDVSNFHWAKDYIQKASGYLNANTKSRFNPEGDLLRQDAAVALVNIAAKQNEKYDKKTLDKFSDKELVSEQYEKYIALAVGYGLMNGNANGTFNPTGSVTRAETCQMLYNLILKSQEDSKQKETSDDVFYSGDIDIKLSIPEKEEEKEENNSSKDENGVIIVKPIVRNYSNQDISLNVKVEGKQLAEWGTYTIGPEELVIASIENASSSKNYIYYMLSYGKDFSTTIVKKVASSIAEITIPEELMGSKVKISIWGTSTKNGKGYVTATQIFYLNYSSDLKHRGESYAEQTGVKTSDKKVDFIVVFNGDIIGENDIIEYAKKEQKIIIRGKPVNNMQSINYRWDKEIEYTSVNAPTATIEIPSSFTDGSTHKLTITVTDKQGRTYIPRSYKFIINARASSNDSSK